MRISIDLNDEAQLKKEIKELIAGELRAIAREEARQISADEMRRILNSQISVKQSDTDRMILNAVTEKVRTDLGLNYWNSTSTVIKNTTDAVIRELVPAKLDRLNYDKLVAESIETVKKDLVNKLLGK